jgi:hypothetical protein
MIAVLFWLLGHRYVRSKTTFGDTMEGYADWGGGLPASPPRLVAWWNASYGHRSSHDAEREKQKLILDPYHAHKVSLSIFTEEGGADEIVCRFGGTLGI